MCLSGGSVHCGRSRVSWPSPRACGQAERGCRAAGRVPGPRCAQSRRPLLRAGTSVPLSCAGPGRPLPSWPTPWAVPRGHGGSAAQHPSPHQTLLLGAPPPPSPAPALEFAPPLRLFRHLGGGVLAQPTVGSLVGPERLRPAGASGLCLGAGRRYKQSSGTGRLSQCHSSPQGLVLVSSPLLMEETGTEGSVNLLGPRSK